MMVRKKDFIDDMYHAIGAEDITVCHRGTIHLQSRSDRATGIQAQILGIFDTKNEEGLTTRGISRNEDLQVLKL
jgi:hypothetical protein